MYSVQGSLWVDPSLEDGYLRVAPNPKRPGARLVFMTVATYRALMREIGTPAALLERLGDREGTFLLPRSVIEPEAAEDLALGLSLVDPEPSDVCIYPPCGLAAEVVHEDGFPLCREHHALMGGWDDLLVG